MGPPSPESTESELLAQKLEEARAQTLEAFDRYLKEIGTFAKAYMEKDGPGNDISSGLFASYSTIRKARAQFEQNFEKMKAYPEQQIIQLVKTNSWLRSAYVGSYTYMWKDMLKNPGNTGTKYLRLAIEAARLECEQIRSTIDRAPVNLTDSSQEIFGTKQVWEVAEQQKIDDYKTRLQNVVYNLNTAVKQLNAGDLEGAARTMRDAATNYEKATITFNKHLSSRAVAKGIDLRRERDPFYKDLWNFFSVDHTWILDLAMLAAGFIPVVAPGSVAYFAAKGTEEAALGVINKDWKQAAFGVFMAITPTAKATGLLGKIGRGAGIALIGGATIDSVRIVIDGAQYGFTPQDLEALAANGVMTGFGFIHGGKGSQKAQRQTKETPTPAGTPPEIRIKNLTSTAEVGKAGKSPPTKEAVSGNENAVQRSTGTSTTEVGKAEEPPATQEVKQTPEAPRQEVPNLVNVENAEVKRVLEKWKANIKIVPRKELEAYIYEKVKAILANLKNIEMYDKMPQSEIAEGGVKRLEVAVIEIDLGMMNKANMENSTLGDLKMLINILASEAIRVEHDALLTKPNPKAADEFAFILVSEKVSTEKIEEVKKDLRTVLGEYAKIHGITENSEYYNLITAIKSPRIVRAVMEIDETEKKVRYLDKIGGKEINIGEQLQQAQVKELHENKNLSPDARRALKNASQLKEVDAKKLPPVLGQDVEIGWYVAIRPVFETEMQNWLLEGARINDKGVASVEINRAGPTALNDLVTENTTNAILGEIYPYVAEELKQLRAKSGNSGPLGFWVEKGVSLEKIKEIMENVRQKIRDEAKDNPVLKKLKIIDIDHSVAATKNEANAAFMIKALKTQGHEWVNLQMVEPLGRAATRLTFEYDRYVNELLSSLDGKIDIGTREKIRDERALDFSLEGRKTVRDGSDMLKYLVDTFKESKEKAGVIAEAMVVLGEAPRPLGEFINEPSRISLEKLTEIYGQETGAKMYKLLMNSLKISQKAKATGG